MITAEDIDAFGAENKEAIAAACRFSRRYHRGIPPDRWATTREMQLVAQGIDAQVKIIQALTQVIVDAMEEYNANTPNERRGQA